jgi:hypothetical protein
MRVSRYGSEQQQVNSKTKKALFGFLGAAVLACIPVLLPRILPDSDFSKTERDFWAEKLPPILEETNLVKRIDRITVLASLSPRTPPAIDELIKRWQDELQGQLAAERAAREAIERERRARLEQDLKKKQEALAKAEAAKANEAKAKSDALKKAAASTRSVTSILHKLKL